jgi:glucose-6-phosphate isomerase
VDEAPQIRVAERLAAMEPERVLERIWARDHTVWRAAATEIPNRLGWIWVSDLMHARVDELEAFAMQVRAEGLRTAVLLGMGGSSLAPEMFATTFGAAEDALELIVLDTTHPATIARLTDELDLATTLFVVSSKSGTTTETTSQLAHFWDLARDGRRFAAITDPGTPLEVLARERAFREVFRNPEDIGGRYSALSFFGLVPAALIGAPIQTLLDRADEMRGRSGPPVPEPDSPAAELGAAIGEAAKAGLDKLTLLLPAEVASFGDWVEQLIAESTGKQGVGIVPVVGEAPGPLDVYGRDRLFVAVGEHAAADALQTAGHPVAHIDDGGPQALGAEIFRWELATAVAGHVLEIDPFDQPNVQEAKDATERILHEGDVEDPGFDDLGTLLGSVREGDYVALMAYLDRTPETENALGRARLGIRDRYRVATTLGFGPRFLHSTGQLHKGGPNTGVFVQIVDDGREIDLPIPGRDHTFGTLIDAQALGDLRSLRAHGRRVARVPLSALAEVG